MELAIITHTNRQVSLMEFAIITPTNRQVSFMELAIITPTDRQTGESYGTCYYNTHRQSDRRVLWSLLL